jgi:hypothetical protein
MTFPQHRFNRLKRDRRDSAFARALRRVNGGRGCEEVVSRLTTNLHRQLRVSEPPYPPKRFAEMLNLPVYEADIEAEGVLTTGAALAALRRHEEDSAGHISTWLHEGLYVNDDDDGPRVLVRKIDKGERMTCALHRRAFTLAHEIGHYVLRHEVSGVLRDSFVDDPFEEYLCNQFAEELLMPRMSFVNDLKKVGIGPEALLYLQWRYDVSLQALLCRVSGLFRGGVVAMLWRQGDSRAPVIDWAAPRKYRGGVLCNTGQTPIEAAFGSAGLKTGRCEVLLDGVRARWEVGAFRLSSNKILSVFHRSMKKLRRYIPIPEDLALGSGVVQGPAPSLSSDSPRSSRRTSEVLVGSPQSQDARELTMSLYS